MRRPFSGGMLALALAACAAPPAPPASVDPRVVIVPGLPITTGAPLVTKQSGMLRVTATLANGTPQDIPVLATTDWIDPQGRSIASVVSRPRRLTVPRFGDAVLDSIAPRASATGFRIRVELDPANF
jgi:uncharacterized protein YcfL